MIKTQEDAVINDARRLLYKIFTSHFIARVQKDWVGFYCEKELDLEHNCNILTPHSYGRYVVSFSFFWCSTGGLGPTLLDAGFPHCILSASSLDPKLHRGSRGPPRSDVAFPTTSHLQLSGTLLATALARRTQLNYKIVRRPLDLWNWMFNLHQAGITVRQFRGHSLPVHQSMNVPCEFFLARPFSSANFRLREFLSELPLECVTSFRCITLEWHFWSGQKVKTQHFPPYWNAAQGNLEVSRPIQGRHRNS